MAENKKGFVLYADLIHTVELMTSSKAGNLFKHILRYVNDLNPKTGDTTIKLVFEPIKQQLKRDLKKYEERKKKYSDAGKRSAEVRREKQKATSLNAVKQGLTKPTVIVKDTVTVNVKDNVNVNVKDKVIHIEEAYEFLKIKEPEKIELFEMQNESSFIDYDVFIVNFNSKVIEESLDWDKKILMARLIRLNMNWDKTPKDKNQKPPTAEENLEKELKNFKQT